MNAWRISIFADLLGMGGELSTGRWHTPQKGKRIVYLSEHPAVALIETLVNLRGNERRLPEAFQLMRIEVLPEAAIGSIMESRCLPTGAKTSRRRSVLATLGSTAAKQLCSPFLLRHLRSRRIIC